MKRALCPTALRMLVRYEPSTGKLYWRHRPLFFCKNRHSHLRINNSYCGKEAFITKNDGYKMAKILGITYSAHRVAWCVFYGAWPHELVDHINGKRDDNRIENLRAVTRAENNLNTGIIKTNTSGRTGVSWQKATKKWHAYIKKNQKRYHLGLFKRKEDAIKARRVAERELEFFENKRRSINLCSN